MNKPFAVHAVHAAATAAPETATATVDLSDIPIDWDAVADNDGDEALDTTAQPPAFTTGETTGSVIDKTITSATAATAATGETNDGETTKVATYQSADASDDVPLPANLDFDESTESWSVIIDKPECLGCPSWVSQKPLPDDYDQPECHYTAGNEACPCTKIKLVIVNMPKTKSQILTEKLIAAIDEKRQGMTPLAAVRATLTYIDSWFDQKAGALDENSPKWKSYNGIKVAVEKHYFESN